MVRTPINIISDLRCSAKSGSDFSGESAWVVPVSTSLSFANLTGSVDECKIKSCDGNLLKSKLRDLSAAGKGDEIEFSVGFRDKFAF